MKKIKSVYFLITGYFISRIIFIIPQAVFFDGPEYVRRLEANSFLSNFKLGHAPFHSGYFIISWPVYQLAKLYQLAPINLIKLVGSLFGALSLYLFFKTAQLWSGSRKQAWLAALLVSLSPLFWTTNVGLLIEAIYPAWFWLSLFYWQKYQVKNRGWPLALASLFLSLTYLTQPAALVWLPFFFLKPYHSSLTKKTWVWGGIGLGLSLIIGRFIDLQLSIYGQNLGWQSQLFWENFNFYLRTFFSLNWHNWLRVVRNLIWFNFSTVTPLIIIPAMLALIKIRKTQPQRFIKFLILGLTLLVISQSMDVNLGGRHTLLAVFAWAWLAADWLKNKKILKFMALLGLLITSLIKMTGWWQPIPYLAQQEKIAQLPQNQLLIIEHYARPFTNYAGELILVNEPGWLETELENKINYYLDNQKQVFVTSGALTDPHLFYTGPWRHPISKGYSQPSLFWLKQKYQLEPYLTIISAKQLYLYQVIKNSNLADDLEL